MLKQLQQVEELAVYVSTYGDWGIDMLHVGLFHEDLSRFKTELFHLRFGDGLASLQLLDLPAVAEAKYARRA